MFKKRVLLKAQEELKKYTDISFTFEEIKQGRKIVTIKFIINNQKKYNTHKLLLKDEKIIKAKIDKEKLLYKKEDKRLEQSLKDELIKKQLVTDWIEKNDIKYKKLLDELKEVYLARGHIQAQILRI